MLADGVIRRGCSASQQTIRGNYCYVNDRGHEVFKFQNDYGL